MNQVSIIGRLTADPELKHTQNDKAFTRFTVAVDRPTKQGEEKQADKENRKFSNLVETALIEYLKSRKANKNAEHAANG